MADSLVALHSTDPASVFLSANARMRDGAMAHVEKALYDDRSLVRILGMRRTLFVVPVALVPIVHARAPRRSPQPSGGATRASSSRAASPTTAAWLDRVGGATMAALQRRGEAFGAELSADVPELRSQVSFGEGKKWAGPPR